MASDLSSGSTEVNELLDDEKEEGEISLEDVSSSEEGQLYKYPPRAFGQCPYCLSTQQCATWCRSLTVNKHGIREAHRIVAEDAGLQGKENRGKHRYHPPKDHNPEPHITVTKVAAVPQYSTLQEKNDVDDDLVPISSDSDMELVGLGHDVTKAERQKSRKKTRKKRRKKSPSVLSLSLSPSSVDLALSLKESIHRIEPGIKDGYSKARHHSPDRKKVMLVKSPPQRRHRSPSSRIRVSPTTKRKTKSPLLRKSSPVKTRKQSLKKSSPPSPENVAEPTTLVTPTKRGTVMKLLKKVKDLDPFSLNINERTSLKDKLSNIIKNKTTDTVTANSEEAVSNKDEKTTETGAKDDTTAAVAKDKEEETPKDTKDTKDKEKEAPVQVKSEDNEDEEDLVILRQMALQTKQKKSGILKPEEIKTEPIEQPSVQPPLPQTPPQAPPPEPPPKPQKPEQQPEQKLPNFCMDDNDEDLELRMIALRSAVLKKHRTRMQCGGLKKKLKPKSETPVPRIESPFTSTFLEDFPLLAEICSPASPLSFKKDTYGTEDMELDSDMDLDAAINDSGNESPYSPTDDIDDPPISTPMQNAAVNLSLYSPSHPTETPYVVKQEKPMNDNALDGSILEFTSQESRPYSPTDVTIYDPDLPGVHGSQLPPLPPPPPPPLEPPPLPPLGMFTPQPMMLGCATNLLNTFCDASMAPMAPMNNFTAMHQSMNPLMIPAATPLFAYPAPPMSTTTLNMPTSSMSIPPPQPQPPPTEPANVTNELDDFGETDLDGSPLVPIDKDNNQQATSWPLIGEPLYLQGVPDVTQSELCNVPTLLEHNLVPTAVLKTNPKLQKQSAKRLSPQQHEQINEGAFRNADMRPVSLATDTIRINSHATFKPIKLHSTTKKSPISKSAAAFNGSINEEPETEDREETKNQKRRKSVTPSPAARRRKRKKSMVARRHLKELERKRTPRRELDDRVLREKNSRSPGIHRMEKSESSKDVSEEQKKKSEEKRRRASIDDDEETLRKLLLASLEKRKKEQPEGNKIPATTTPSSDTTAKKTNESISNAVAPGPDKPPTTTPSSTAKSETTPKVVPSQIPKHPAVITATSTKLATTTMTTTTVAVKRPATVPIFLTESLRKIAKKPSMIPASTKVVNNAKRYQNLLLQRRLTQQKLLAATKSRFRVNNNGARSASPNVMSKSSTEMQRIIINLNEDSESESDIEEARAKISPVKSRPPLAIPTTDFEKSVDQFLKNVRQQQEQQTIKNVAVTSANESSKSQPIAKNVMTSVAPQKVTVSTKTTTTTATVTSLATTKTTSSASLAVTKATNIAITKTASTTSLATTKITATSSSTLASLTKEKLASSTMLQLKSSAKLASLSITPQAVKHLPASQQEEYRRLKLQILEREQLKLQKSQESAAIATTSQPSVEKTVITSLAASSPSTSSTTALVSTSPKAVPKTSAVTTSSITKPLVATTLVTKPSAVVTSPTAKLLAAATTLVTKPSAVVTSPAAKLLAAATTLVTKPSAVVTPPAVKALGAATSSVTKPLAATTSSMTKPSTAVTSPVAKPSTIVTSSIVKLSTVVTSPMVKPSTDTASPGTKSSAISTSPLARPTADLTSLLTKTQEASTLNKTLPKTQLVATISPMSKLNAENSVSTSKPPLVATPTKIIHSTVNSNQNSNTLSKTASTTFLNKVNVATKPSVTSTSKIMSQTNNSNIQAAMLNKINDTLNNQKKQVTAVAHKVSTLRILTKEQINLKTTRIQQSLPKSENRVVMDDLNICEKKQTASGRDNSSQIEELKNSKNVTDKSMNTSKNVLDNSSRSLDLSYTSVSQSPSVTTDKSKKNWEDYKQEINNEVQALSQLSLEEQRKILLKTEEELVKKRHMVLDDISEMSGNLREWEFERDVQKRLSDQIKKLREELRIAEEQLQQQKEKLNTIQPKVSLYHEKINSGRKECFRLSKICNSLGQQIQGTDYAVPTAAADLLNNKIKEIAIHTQKLRNKKVQSKETTKVNNSTKTDKTRVKNNFNSKSKKLNKKEKIVNNVTEISGSQSDLNSTAEIIHILTNESLVETANTNTNLNLENVNNTNNQNESMEIDVKNSNIIFVNNNVESNILSTEMIVTNPTLNSENNFNNEILNNNNSSAILNAENVFSLKVEKQTNIISDTNEISPENVINNETERLSSEVTEILTSNTLTNPEKLTEPGTVSKGIVNPETANQLTESITENSSLISNNAQNENQTSLNAIGIENTTVIEESDQLKNRSSLNSYPLENSVLTQENVTLQNEKLSHEDIAENESEKLPENICERMELITENNISVESVDMQSAPEISVVNTNLPTENITGSESNDLPMETNTLNAENNEMKEDFTYTESVIITATSDTESVENNRLTELTKEISTEVEKNTNVEKHSSLMEEITLLELANETEVPERITYSFESSAREDVEQLIEPKDSSLKRHESSKKVVVQPYESILKHLQVPRNNKTDGVLCPYELMGTCNDGDCQFIHQSTSHCQ